MDLKGRADFSSYILFEASGDSEADFDGIVLDDGYDDRDGDDDDDAMSCSFDRSDDGAEIKWGECSCDADADKDEDDEHDDDGKKKEGVYGTSYCEDDETLQEEEHKSLVSFDSSQEFVDEMEKNRLFWEACLAS